MKKGEYIILKKSDIEDKIKELEKEIKYFNHGIIYNLCKSKIETYKSILSSGITDLYGVVEGAYREGFNGCIELDSITDYLNNLEL